MAGILTKGITLSYSSSSSGSFTDLTNLMSIPAISNGSPSTIDVTTLESTVKQYIKGLQDPGGNSFDFQFLYNPASSSTPDSQFVTLNGLTSSQYWKVSMPDGLCATFQGSCSVGFDEASPDAAITYTLSIVVESAISFS